MRGRCAEVNDTTRALSDGETAGKKLRRALNLQRGTCYGCRGTGSLLLVRGGEVEMNLQQNWNSQLVYS